MAKRLTIAESVISLTFDGKKAEQQLKKLRDQIKDNDKTDRVNQRRSSRRSRKQMRDATREHKIRKEMRKRSDESFRARENLEKRLKRYREEKAKADKKERVEGRKEIDQAVRERKREKKWLREKAKLQARERRNAENQRIREDRRRANQRSESRASSYRTINRVNNNVASAGYGMAAGATGLGVAAVAAGASQIMSWEDAVRAIYTQETSRNGTEGAMERTTEITDRLYQLANALNVADPALIAKLFNELRPLTASERKDGTSYGITDEHIFGMITTMTQSAKAMGVDGVQLARFMQGFRQFTSNISAGTASGQEINEMRDASPTLANALFESMGFAGNISPDAAAKLTQAGTLNLDSIMNAMAPLQLRTAEGFRMYMEESMRGSFDSLQVSANHLLKVFGEGTQGGLIQSFDILSRVMSENEDLVRSMGQATGNLLVRMATGVENLVNAWTAMSPEEQDELINTISTIGKVLGSIMVMSMAASALAPLFKLFSAITMLARLTPVGALATLILAVGSVLGALNYDTISNFVDSAKEKLGGFVDGVKESMGGSTISESLGVPQHQPYNPYGAVSSQYTTNTTANRNSGNSITNNTTINGVTVESDVGRNFVDGLFKANPYIIQPSN